MITIKYINDLITYVFLVLFMWKAEVSDYSVNDILSDLSGEYSDFGDCSKSSSFDGNICY